MVSAGQTAAQAGLIAGMIMVIAVFLMNVFVVGAELYYQVVIVYRHVSAVTQNLNFFFLKKRVRLGAGSWRRLPKIKIFFEKNIGSSRPTSFTKMFVFYFTITTFLLYFLAIEIKNQKRGKEASSSASPRLDL